MAVSQQVKATSRDRAIVLLSALCDRFTPQSEWRHTDVAEIVDALIDAAREPESAHCRALEDERRTQEEGKRS